MLSPARLQSLLATLPPRAVDVRNKLILSQTPRYDRSDPRGQLSQISPGARLGIAGVVFRGAGPGLLGQAPVSLHAWKRRPGALRRVITALQLVIVASLLVLILIAVENVAVAGVRAVLRRGVLRRRVSTLAQAPIRPRMLGPTLLSNGGAHRRARYVVDVADALHTTVSLVPGDRPRWQLRRRRRVAASAAHVLARQAAGVRRGRRRGLLASRSKPERSAQRSLLEKVSQPL